MTEVILSTESVTVFGGAPTIAVDSSFGAKGNRGSLIYAVDGNPNSQSVTLPSDLRVYDLATNIKENDSEYLTMYQYVNQDGQLYWIPLLRLIPKLFGKNFDATFVSGETTILIPAYDVFPDETLTPANFNIQYSIETSSPTSSGMNVSEGFVFAESDADEENPLIEVTLTAIDLTGPVSGNKKVHVFITIVGEL